MLSTKTPSLDSKRPLNLEIQHCHTAAHYSLINSFGCAIFIKKQMGVELQRAAMICTGMAPECHVICEKGRGDLTANFPIVLSHSCSAYDLCLWSSQVGS